jgi:eukaryotic-like serine/threonine-protein kinase
VEIRGAFSGRLVDADGDAEPHPTTRAISGIELSLRASRPGPMMPPQEHDSNPISVDRLPGRLIAGNFRIDKLIGSGAMGNVYKAEQLSLGKAVAVKVLHAHLMSDEKLVLRFKREAKSASLLNHPNSIQIIDSGQDADGTLYIAMELLAGRDLAQVIRDDFPLPLPRVVRIMSQVLAALDEAHAQGVIHRDLKPSNIMLIERRGEKDFVKVCDFGIAKATTADTKEEDREAMLTIQGLVCGTPEYMAPEQARAEPLDGRADLYAAAVILYQLVTGDIPFRADTPMGIVSRHLAEPPMVPSRRRPDLPIPKAIDDIILHGLEKLRDQRYPTAVAFREALEAVVTSGSGQFTPFPPGVRAAMPTATELGREVHSETTSVVPAGPPRPSAADDGARDSGKGAGRRFPTITALGVALGLAAIGAALALQHRGPDAVAGAQHAGIVAAPSELSAAVVRPAPAPVEARPVAVAPPAAAAPAEEAARPVGAPARVGAGTVTTATTTVEAASRSAGERSKRKKPAEHVASAAVLRAPAEAPPAVETAAAPVVADAPAPRGPHEVLREGEKLLGQGEVRDACARGEEAKRMSPKVPAAYRFLGKCYMRAGNTGLANDNYKKYLELAPTASDAPFIKSIIK